ncbi:MAG: sirohydrochlorin cobaltochelatase [Deltaproteobacteria bacterium]|nr:sirohydrochlorin cobaltochelatase [Deltaproteobacteria bacterium]MBW2137402.1 sirohydrochlorin cobaltochelatase [Deltaproteobacteria bacterium]
MRKLVLWFAALFVVLVFTPSSFAMGHGESERAIVLASFGTSYPAALKGILNITKEVEKAFPGVTVRMAFTSDIIRGIWEKRRGDEEFFSEHKDIPREIAYVKGPLATIADLQDGGYRTIIVQPTHIYSGEEYTDLASCVAGLNSIKTIKPRYRPFEKLVLSRPLLGTWGDQHDYHGDLEAVAEILAEDVAEAREKGAALVYMGHGNEFYSTGAYIEFQQVMRRRYPDVPVFVGTVEGFPSLDDVVSGLVSHGVKVALLKPFMIVAGDHARNDMAGDDEESWKNVISKKGIRIITRLEGLGEKPGIARTFVRYIRETAEDNGVSLGNE